MAKSVTRYDEVGNAVIREARPAPRDVKAKGAVAVAEWNKANKPQPGKTGEQDMQIVERQIYKRAADMRAKKTIASTARSFSGGQLLEALSANNGPKVAPDAPVTQKRAAIASGMAARAANRTEAGGSDGGPKRRAAERFARVARGESPFGGDAVAKGPMRKVSKAEQAFNEKRSATPKTKGLPPNERAVKLAGTVDARVRAKGSWNSDDLMRRHSRLGRITAAAEAVERKPVADPAKVMAKRNETARSLAEQKKATGVDAGRGAAARDLVARNDRDVASKLRDLSTSQLRQVAKESGVHVGTKMPRGQIVAAITNRIYMARRDGAKVATASELYGADVPKDQVRQAAASSEAKQAEKINSAIDKVKAASPAKPAKASRAGKQKAPRTVSIMGDNKYLTPPGARGLTNAQKDAMVVKGGPPPSFIDKVNAAQAASDAARRNAPKPPATPPGPRDHWNRVGSPQPIKAATSIPPPAVKAPPVVTNDSAMGMASDQAKRAEARTAYNKAGGTDQRGRMFEALSGQPRVTSDWRTTLAKANTGLAVVGTGVAAAQAFNRAKQEGKSTGEAMGAGALAAAPGALMLGGSKIGAALSTAGSVGMEVGKEAIKGGTTLSMGNVATNFAIAKGGMAVWAGGAALKTAGEVLKGASKVAGPAMMAWHVYQGAKEDQGSAAVGAGRGLVRSLDPSGIVTGIGAGLGAWKDGRGLGERAYDAAFGGPTQGRLSSTQAQTFARADTNYDHMGQGQPQATSERPGWSPEARIAAAQARGAVNLPYGGDPTQAPGYTPPKDRRPY